jgi:hypothetical protein
VLLEIRLIGIEHTVHPRQQFFSAMIRVKDDGDTISRRDGSDKVSCGDSACDRGVLGLGVVGDAFSGEKGGTTLRALEDDGGFQVTSGLEGGVDGRGRGDVLMTVAKTWSGWWDWGLGHLGTCSVTRK